MTTLNQIVTILAERVGRQYDLVFKRQLKTMVGMWRETILRQALKDNPKDQSYFQSSWTMPIVEDYEVKCPFNYGCVMRTKDPLPSTLRIDQIPFTFIGSPDLKTSYTFIYPNQLEFANTSRNRKKDAVYYTLLDGYGYFYNLQKKVKYIGVQAIPTDLYAVGKFKKCNSTEACYSDDLPYPLTGDLVQRLIQAILGTELKTMIQTNNPEEVKV